MLHEFLLKERSGILALCAKKVLHVAESRTSSDEMERGLPVFFDELVGVLRNDANESRREDNQADEDIHKASAQRRGKESLRLGYSVSQVVHGYGALCQAITQYVEE